MQIHRNYCQIGVSLIVRLPFHDAFKSLHHFNDFRFFFLFTACTAERFFRIDRAQEHLHYLTDIATETMYILDQELMTLPQTPDEEKGVLSGMPNKRSNNFSSGSSDNLERESHENTPTSPFANQTFFNRLSAAPGSNSDSGMDSRKCKKSSPFSLNHALSLMHTNAFVFQDSQDSQNSQNSPKQSEDKDDANVSFDRMVNFKR